MKSEYKIGHIEKKDCVALLKDHHYLSKIQKGFKSGVNYGLYKGDELVGVCIFTGFPVPELAKGCYGLERDDQEGLYELSRLVLAPSIQVSEHNIASWFVSRCMKALKKEQRVRAILSYADTGFHEGTIYAALNFKYFGLSAVKKDFFILQEDGSFKKHSRGKVKGIAGEWRNRNQKHRFLITIDKRLTCRWGEIKWGGVVCG